MSPTNADKEFTSNLLQNNEKIRDSSPLSLLAFSKAKILQKFLNLIQEIRTQRLDKGFLSNSKKWNPISDSISVKW